MRHEGDGRPEIEDPASVELRTTEVGQERPLKTPC
jgi:hypothetical protein